MFAWNHCAAKTRVPCPQELNNVKARRRWLCAYTGLCLALLCFLACPAVAAAFITQLLPLPEVTVLDRDKDGTYDFAFATERDMFFLVEPYCWDGKVPSPVYWLAMDEWGTPWSTLSTLTGQVFDPDRNPGVPAGLQLPAGDDPGVEFPAHVNQAAIAHCNSQPGSQLADGMVFPIVNLATVVGGAFCVEEPGTTITPNEFQVLAMLCGIGLVTGVTAPACGALIDFEFDSSGNLANGISKEDVKYTVRCRALDPEEPGRDFLDDSIPIDPDTFNQNEPVEVGLQLLPNYYKGECPVDIALLGQAEFYFNDSFEYWFESTDGWHTTKFIGYPDSQTSDGTWEATFSEMLTVPVMVFLSGGILDFGIGSTFDDRGSTLSLFDPNPVDDDPNLQVDYDIADPTQNLPNLHKAALRLKVRTNGVTLASSYKHYSVECDANHNNDLELQGSENRATALPNAVVGGAASRAEK